MYTYTYYKDSEFANTLMTRGSQKSDDTCFLEFILMLPMLWNGCFGILCQRICAYFLLCLFILSLFNLCLSVGEFIALHWVFLCTPSVANWWTSCIWIYFKVDYKTIFKSFGASQVAQWIKNLPAIQAIRVGSMSPEDPLEEGMATSNILPWRIPLTEELGGLQSMGSQRVGHDWSNWALTHFKSFTSFTYKDCVSILKEINPEYSLKGLMLKLQYFGHLMWRADSLEKTLMLGKTEGKRRRQRQRKDG